MSHAATRAVIADLYRQVDAPGWAAANLDGLADILRDLSWLPDGPVEITVPPLGEVPRSERHALLDVLQRAVDESATSPHPLRAEPPLGTP
jgi:hypothetical protein